MPFSPDAPSPQIQCAFYAPACNDLMVMKLSVFVREVHHNMLAEDKMHAGH
jgi:hypothetical protein